MKRFTRSSPPKILLITLSNIGDVILTLPVFDVVHADFPTAEIDVIVGPRAYGLLEYNPHIHQLLVYDKSMSWKNRWAWANQLYHERYDLIVDLRNSILPYYLHCKRFSFPLFAKPLSAHRRDKHLAILQTAHRTQTTMPVRCGLVATAEDQQLIAQLCGNFLHRPYVVVVPSAADERKRWTAEGFAVVSDYLISHYKYQVVFVGDVNDQAIAQSVQVYMKHRVVNLCGQTNLRQMSLILDKAQLVLGNDTGVLHMASYLDKRVIALFGPTDPAQYGPWSTQNITIDGGRDLRADLKEVPDNRNYIMKEISEQMVIKAIDDLLQKSCEI